MVEHAEHISWLRERLAEFEAKLADAEATVARLRPVVANLQGTIATLATPELGQTPSVTLFGEPASADASPSTKRRRARAKKGTRLPPMRQPGYMGLSTPESVRQMFSTATGPIHADDAVRTIFVCKTPSEFQAAKHTVVATLSRGAKAGWLMKLGGNRYARKDSVIATGEATS